MNFTDEELEYFLYILNFHLQTLENSKKVCMRYMGKTAYTNDILHCKKMIKKLKWKEV